MVWLAARVVIVDHAVAPIARRCRTIGRSLNGSPERAPAAAELAILRVALNFTESP